MSESEIEIVVDDPTAPEPDSPAVADTRVVDVTVSLLLLALALTLGFDNWRTRAAASIYGLVTAFLGRKKASETFVTRAQLRRVMAVFVPTLLFCLATQFLGMYVASFLLIAGFMRLIGKI